MASTTPTVAATLRERLGTRYTPRLRAQGLLPVVIYGHGEKPVSAAVNAKEVLGHLHHGSHVITVAIGKRPERTSSTAAEIALGSIRGSSPWTLT